MTKLLITNESGCPIKPRHIDTSVHFFEAFDHSETEVSARWIVRFMQERGGWVPFTRADIEGFYKRHDRVNFTFNRLIHPGIAYRQREAYRVGGGWIVEHGGKLHVTLDFVLRCYGASPKDLKAIEADAAPAA